MAKSTCKEVDRRVQEIADHLLAFPLTNHFKLHDLFCPQFGVTWQQIDRYAMRARALNKQRLKLNRDEMAEIGKATLLSLLGSASEKIRLKAEEQLRALAGYGAAPRLPEDADGRPAQFIPLTVNPADITGEGKKK